LSLLVVGAELVVRGATCVATMLGVAPMVIGLTIVSIGTSTPELAVSVSAGLQGNGGLGVGNVAGANVCVMLLVVGISAIMQPLPLHLQVFKLELPMIVFAAFLMTFLAWDGVLSRTDGCIMLTAGLGYTSALIWMTRRASLADKVEFREEYGPETMPPTRRKWRRRLWYAGMIVAGIALTVAGSDLLVRGAVVIARSMGVSPAVVGLTVVALGTSSPELVMTIVSTLKNDRDVALGNILGSGVYNILVILSIACIVTPGGLPVEPQLLSYDIPLMLGVALGAIPVFLTGKRVSRIEGITGVCIYLGYLWWLLLVRN
ncbi:MAG TPA: calcium/sodium antiporter, partial [Planctomycetaceae bacterium]|nr:calcium/sodium antiporter [Planctomycetaceae bacterium]